MMSTMPRTLHTELVEPVLLEEAHSVQELHDDAEAATPVMVPAGNQETWSPTRAMAFKFLFFVSLVVNLVVCLSIAKHTTTPAVPSPENSRELKKKDQGWSRPPVVYGLVHMAKTAGSEINGELANHFERVCGNKGYSYDALENNKRTKEAAASVDVSETKLTNLDLHDEVGKLYPGSNRGKVGRHWMEEIGYDDCDYIALEESADYWFELAERWPMELHIPCREPLSHLMSQCNNHAHIFDCESNDLQREIKKCVVKQDRYSHKLLHHDNITAKCFDAVPPGPYIKYMGDILQRKRVESEYFHRTSNIPRDKEHECIWNKGPEFQERVLEILRGYEYYEYCEDCMGTSDELPLGLNGMS